MNLINIKQHYSQKLQYDIFMVFNNISLLNRDGTEAETGGVWPL